MKKSLNHSVKQNKKKASYLNKQIRGFIKRFFGGVLLSHTATHAVPSALKGLTSEFGMVSGVSPLLSPPKKTVSAI
jgi:hypothetical protein